MHGGADFPFECLVDGLGGHAADIAPVNEEELVARAHACFRSGEPGRRFADGDPTIGSRLRQHGTNRTCRRRAAGGREEQG
jgi:hypothetical protein